MLKNGTYAAHTLFGHPAVLANVYYLRTNKLTPRNTVLLES